MNIKVMKNDDNLIIEKNGKVEVFESYTASDILLHFENNEDIIEEKSIEELFKNISKDKVKAGIDSLEAEALTFMTKKDLEKLKKSYQKEDLSDAKLIKEYN